MSYDDTDAFYQWLAGPHLSATCRAAGSCGIAVAIAKTAVKASAEPPTRLNAINWSGKNRGKFSSSPLQTWPADVPAGRSNKPEHNSATPHINATLDSGVSLACTSCRAHDAGFHKLALLSPCKQGTLSDSTELPYSTSVGSAHAKRVRYDLDMI